MSYWIDTLSEIFDEHGIAATTEQLAAVARDVAGAASVEIEYSGLPQRTRPGAPQKSPDTLRIERLEEAVRRLSWRLGVTTSVERMEISYLTPVGTSHYGTTREDL